MSSGENAKPDRFPPPQISDLLVLTLCASVVFGFNAPSYQDALKLYTIGWRDLLPNLLDESVTALCLFGLIVLSRQAIRRATYPVAPGHVVLLAMGPFVIFGLVLGVFRPFYSGRSVLQAIDSGLCAIVLAASLVYLLIAIRRLEWWWRVSLYLLASMIAMYLLECALDPAINVGLIGYLYRRNILAAIGSVDALIVLSACAAVAIDLRHRIRRDWLHYVGLVVLLSHTSAAMMHWGRITLRVWQGLYDRVFF